MPNQAVQQVALKNHKVKARNHSRPAMGATRAVILASARRARVSLMMRICSLISRARAARLRPRDLSRDERNDLRWAWVAAYITIHMTSHNQVAPEHCARLYEHQFK